MVAWKPFDDPQDVYDYFHVPAASPAEVLGPIIQKYRQLEFLPTPEGVRWSCSNFEGAWHPNEGWSDTERQFWVWEREQRRKIELAISKLKEFYIECGWDGNAKEPTISVTRSS
jgi:hypothetical protein